METYKDREEWMVERISEWVIGYYTYADERRGDEAEGRRLPLDSDIPHHMIMDEYYSACVPWGV